MKYKVHEAETSLGVQKTARWLWWVSKAEHSRKKGCKNQGTENEGPCKYQEADLKKNFF